AAVLARRRVGRLQHRAIGGGDSQAIQPQRDMVEVEQVVGHRRVDRHPGAGLRKHGGGRAQPGLVGLDGRGGTQDEGEGGGEAGESKLHRELLVVVVGRGSRGQGRTVSRTSPSSLLPLASERVGWLAGQVNGMRTTSRPPTSRAASTTSSYSPGT